MTNNQITYKRLGEYIREVNVRNRELKVNLSQGICNDKYFQNPKQVADNPETHKIVRTGQFAYNRATTRNGDKLSIALRQGPDCTVSAAYQVFEVSRPDLLLPEYLMMWFKRPEFDRLALFYSHGSAHEFFEWESMCDVQLPVPSIERQREIVSEYETLTRRIRLNEQMIEKLEATAQALYRHTFVDNIDNQNLPPGWRIGTLTEIATYLNGIACQKFETDENEYLPVLKIRELSQGCCDDNSDHVKKNIPKEYVVNHGDVIFSWSATLFIDIWSGGRCALNQHLFKVTSKRYPQWYYFIWTQIHIAEWKRLISAKATSMGHIKREDLDSAHVIIPSDEALKEMDALMSPIFELYIQKKTENLKITELQSLLLAKMGK